MDKPQFVYVTYIATTLEKLWEALTNPDFNRRYWGGYWMESEWTQGAPWRIIGPDGTVWDTGDVLEIEPPTRLVVSWRHEHKGELQDVGFTRAIFNLEPADKVVKLTVTHEVPAGGEKFIEAVSQGWPHILSALKTLLETGSVLPGADRPPE